MSLSLIPSPTAGRRWLLLVQIGLLPLGCTPQIRDPDETRKTARPIAPDGVDTDKLDVDGGDRTDYKLIELPSDGLLSLEVHWDNPAIEARMQLLDKFGVLLGTQPRNPDTNNDTLDRHTKAGVYFVELSAEHGTSVYSLQTRFVPLDSRDRDVPPPDCVELSDPKYVIQRPVDDEKGTLPEGDAPPERSVEPPEQPCCPPPPLCLAPPCPPVPPGPPCSGPPCPVSPVPCTGPDCPPTVPEDVPPHQTLTGLVLRVAARGPSRTELTLDKGTRDGIEVGVKGQILDAEGRPLRRGSLTVTAVYSQTCHVEVALPVELVPEDARVQLEIEE